LTRFEEEVLEGFVFLVDLDRVLHMIPAESSDGYVAVVFHVFVLFAKGVGRRFEGLHCGGRMEQRGISENREIVLLLSPEEYFKELMEAWSVFGSSLNFECISGDVAMFFGFAF
jgi:hypothetical protein